MALDERLKARLRRLRQDFTYFARNVLKVKPKKPGPLVVFELNFSQRYLHKRLEAQKANTGKVRALVLKGRQGGVSTYVQGRFYHITSMWEGFKAFILTHLQDATDNLFGMTERFYENAPVEVKPHLGASNKRELVFDFLNSEYAVATAGTKGAGRSQAAQLFHGSEVAFWANAKDHMAGVGQIIPNEPGTEIILESTANGMGNWFHKAWQDAEAGLSEYEAIFIPWFWTEDYRLPVPAGYRFSSEDLEYRELHGIDDEQLYWRRSKIDGLDFQGDELLFQQEYPATAAEAFIATAKSYIPALNILRARKAVLADDGGALLLGIDPSRFGDDRTVFVWRQRRKVKRIEITTQRGTMELAGVIANYISETRPAKVFIDLVGLGVGIYDRLIELGYQNIVIGVNAGERFHSGNPAEKLYLNKRSEMWALMKKWFEDGPVQIPDQDEVQADITSPHFTYDSNQRLQIESKEHMRARGVRSTDIADGIGLTFAYPVNDLSEVMGARDHSAPRRIRRKDVSWQAR